MIVALIALGWAYPAGRDLLPRRRRRGRCSLAYEHALVRPDDLTRVNVAFFQVNIADQPRPARLHGRRPRGRGRVVNVVE